MEILHYVIVVVIVSLTTAQPHRHFNDRSTAIVFPCSYNDECPENLTCVESVCLDPCGGPCGENARCEVNVRSLIDIRLDPHPRPRCICNPGYFGNPYSGCYPKPDPVPSGCQTSEECCDNQSCMNGKCSDPCSVVGCGPNTQCKASNHMAACIPPVIEPVIPTPVKPPGPTSCLTSEECSDNQSCMNGKCSDPCSVVGCGPSTQCKASNHMASCIPTVIEPVIPTPVKPPGPTGCLTSEECSDNQSCMNGKCSDPCSVVGCGPSTQCKATNHMASCIPTVIEPVIPTPVKPPGPTGCLTSEECSDNQSCMSGKCSDPCSVVGCGPSTQCKASNHMASCIPTVIEPVIPTPVKPPGPTGCLTSEECSDNQSCMNGKCSDPCSVVGCGPSTQCKATNHMASCIPTVIEPVIPTPVKPPGPTGCLTSEECSDNQSCMSGKCSDPCSVVGCGPSTQCKASNHMASCIPTVIEPVIPTPVKPPGPTGCLTSEECSDNQSCMSGKCSDPCSVVGCGPSTQCKASNHMASCIPTVIEPVIPTPVKPTVVPSVDCTLECLGDDNCLPSRTCVDHHCVDPCPGMCGANSTCTVVNHMPSCECLPGHTGNPFEFCRRQPGSDCPRSTLPATTGVKKFQTYTKTKMDWLEALMQCRKNGQRLATVRNQQEIDDMKNATATSGIRGETFWIAGTDHLHNNEWFWFTTDGMERIGEIQDWVKGQPDNDADDCMSLWAKNDEEGYKWDNGFCGHKRYFVCEYFE